MGYRHRARRRALQCLYQWEATGAPLAGLLEKFWRSQPEEPEVRAFTERLVYGTAGRVETIDPLIEAQADNWRIDRMGVVDRNILRLGIYELMEEKETPAAVVIDEAIELAKKFSGEGAGQFVNGILDGVRKKLESGAPVVDPVEDGAKEVTSGERQASNR